MAIYKYVLLSSYGILVWNLLGQKRPIGKRWPTSMLCKIFGDSQMLHVGNMYLHFLLNVAIFSPKVANPSMEHLGISKHVTQTG